MTKITFLRGAALGALVLGLACGRQSVDDGRVLANVGGQRITEGELRELVHAMMPDAARAKEFLEGQTRDIQDQRTQVIHQMAFNKAVIAQAKAEGLDQDPGVRNLLEQAEAQAYLQALLERRSAGQAMETLVEPAYGYVVAKLKAEGKGQGVPTLEEVKANKALAEQVVSLWRRESLQEEIKSKVPVTYAEGYQR